MSLSLSNNILLSYGTRRIITVFTQACYWTLSWASWIQSAPSIPVSLRSKSHVLFPLLRSCQRISPGPKRFETFRNNNNFLRWGVVAPRPTPKLEDHSLSAVRDCLFNIFAATLRTRRTSLHPQPGTQKLFIVFTRPCHWNSSWSSWMQFRPPHPIHLWSISTLSQFSQFMSRLELCSKQLILLQIITLLIFAPPNILPVYEGVSKSFRTES
jgi:hypothetical protein